jgi:hypothetical protein
MVKRQVGRHLVGKIEEKVVEHVVEIVTRNWGCAMERAVTEADLNTKFNHHESHEDTQ